MFAGRHLGHLDNVSLSRGGRARIRECGAHVKDGVQAAALTNLIL